MSDIQTHVPKRRGRPPKHPRPNDAGAQNNAGETGTAPVKSERRATEERQERRRRDTTDGSRDLKLSPIVEKDPRYEYRWVNDVGSRIHDLTTKDDWDVVTDEDARVVNPNDDRGGLRAVLVRKRRDWYEDDQNKKASLPDERERRIKNGPDAEIGKTSDGRPAGYVPLGGDDRPITKVGR